MARWISSPAYRPGFGFFRPGACVTRDAPSPPSCHEFAFRHAPCGKLIRPVFPVRSQPMTKLFSRILPLASVLALCLATNPTRSTAQDPASYCPECVKICSDCASLCHACYAHCAEQVAAGKKGHAESMKLCLDCGEICDLCAKLAARNGPTLAEVQKLCAKTCEKCAEACGKFEDNKLMSDCAEQCRKCAKHCKAEAEE